MTMIWRRLTPAVLALALLAGAAPARAAGSGLFEMFSTLCLGHVLDADGVKAEALSQGFAASDREMHDGPRKLEAFERETPDATLVLAVNATVRDPLGPIPQANAVTCGLYSSNRDTEAMDQAARWAGVALDPDHSTDEVDYYLFTEINGVRAPLAKATDQQLIDGLTKGRVWMLAVGRDPNAPSIMLTVLRASGQ